MPPPRPAPRPKNHKPTPNPRPENILAHPRTIIQKSLLAPFMVRTWNTKVKGMNNYQLRNTLKRLDHIIDNLRTSGELKVDLTMKMNFTTSKDSEEKCQVTFGIVNGSYRFYYYYYYYYYVKEFFYKCHKVNLTSVKSYIDSPKWIKNKIATITLQNDNNMCFKYAVTVGLNNDSIGKHPERIANIKPFPD